MATVENIKYKLVIILVFLLSLHSSICLCISSQKITKNAETTSDEQLDHGERDAQDVSQ